MKKPINLLINDTKNEVISILNKSGLPISVIAMILNEINIQVGNELNTKLNQELMKYNEELKNQENKFE